jgi:tetratricopeptide (TPR) repeat protein
MGRFETRFVASALAVLSLPFLLACLWDYDTIAMERARFPSALELITGKFVRHSDAYYHWRVQDRLAKLKTRSDDLALRDDLAVAYDKLKQHPLAIDTITKSLELQPERYETLANLGTFHIHAGDLEKGLDYIKQAIAINPDAHFGREVYQQLVVEYVLLRQQSRGEEPLLPLRETRMSALHPGGFDSFLLANRRSSSSEQEIDAAITGILGMMRFGDHRSPVLLEIMGDLLTGEDDERDNKQLAARAYLQAAAGTAPRIQRQYEGFAAQTLSMQLLDGTTDDVVEKVKLQLEAEVAEANRWFQSVVADEQRWIAAGIDVDAAFDKKYYQDPVVGETDSTMSDTYWLTVGTVGTTAAIAGFCVVLVACNRARRRDTRHAER